MPAIPENKWRKPKNILIGRNTYNTKQRTFYFYSNELRFIAIKQSQFIWALLRNHGRRCSIYTFRVMSSRSLVGTIHFHVSTKVMQQLNNDIMSLIQYLDGKCNEEKLILISKNQSIKRVKRDIYTINGWESTVYR